MAKLGVRGSCVSPSPLRLHNRLGGPTHDRTSTPRQLVASSRAGLKAVRAGVSWVDREHQSVLIARLSYTRRRRAAPLSSAERP
jgi:hypothetical protein